MKQLARIQVAVIGLISFSFIFSCPSFSEKTEQAPQAEPTASPQVMPVPEATEAESVGPQTQWLWGRVVSVDATSGEILLKYLDYETDSEKEITIYTDANTAYENVAGLAEVRPEDTMSIDYVVAADGKNTAKNISVEKLEEAPTEPTMPSEPSMPTGTEAQPERPQEQP